MLTRLVRIQLVVFAIASIVGLTVMVFTYVQAPTLLGIGRIQVTVQLPEAGGLYRFANVTYRGVEVGKVTDVALSPTGAEATIMINSSPRIPADVVATVRSMSAVGEQYVDLLPRTAGPPYLQDGSVIDVGDASVPAPVGPMLDKVSALLDSIPKDSLEALLDESFKGLNGAGDDLATILRSASTVSQDVNAVSGRARALIDDSAPLLDAQVQSADATRTWARSLAGITEQVVRNDPDVRHILQTAPGLVQDVTGLLDQVKPTLPVLLANLASVGQVGLTYRPGLEQLLVLLPPSNAYYQASRPINNPVGIPIGDFRVAVDDPPACTVGFLPASQWRSPADTTTIDTPDGLYCKLPQDSPIAVRGARNIPCMEHPGKRAPTVALCNSDMGFQPLAMRPHVLGPPPFDPNLIAQGIPLDGRVPGERPIYGPVEGTPMPATALAPAEIPAAPPPPAAAPSSFTGDGPVPSVATAEYDPRTGRFLTPDGVAITQTDLVNQKPESWRDLVMGPKP